MKVNTNAPLLHGLPVGPRASGSLRSALLQELSRDSINGRGGHTSHEEAHNAAKKAPRFSEQRVEKGEGIE